MSPPNSARPVLETLFGVEEGDIVRAIKTITEEGNEEPDPKAKPCTRGWVHAKAGDTGVVVHTEPGFHPTVMWDRTQTATMCVEGTEFIHIGSR